jgi:glycosyltransferase involved in cell wall biosynthesis
MSVGGHAVRDERQDTFVSVVVPVFNESEVLALFHGRLSRALDAVALPVEIVYINDGSTDGTGAVLQSLRSTDPRIAIIDFTRNFGKEAAMTAGLDHSRGDAVVVIDADLQDPPELIPQLVRCWKQGYDVVYARRTSRRGETVLKRSTSYLFYRIIQRLSRIRIPPDTGDFRLLSRRAVVSLGELREQHRFMKGLFAWIGYPQIAVEYQREPRRGGRTKWNYWGLWNFALEGITAFSTLPLKIAMYLGLLIALMAFVSGTVVIVRTLMYGDPVRGYPSLMVVILFLGAAQLISLGLVGEYLARVADEVKRRPLYLVKYYEPSIMRLPDARAALRAPR